MHAADVLRQIQRAAELESATGEQKRRCQKRGEYDEIARAVHALGFGDFSDHYIDQLPWHHNEPADGFALDKTLHVRIFQRFVLYSFAIR